jgi:hypothetical protein
MPFGTITATESTFGSISGSIVGAVPGTLSGSVGVPGPQGIQGIQGIQGPPGPAGPGSTWGGIAGTLSAQTDLWTELGTKLNSSTAATTYYPLTGNPSGFLTSAPVTSVAGRTGAITLSNTDISGLGTMATASASNYSTTAVADTLYAPIAAGLPTGGTVGQVLTKNSGTNFDASFQTLIPGDRYLTSSTTSLTINNANKTLTIGTGLSYTTQQDIVISYDAANHMHARVLTYNSGTGVMDVDVLSHSGAGTYAAWTVNVGGAPALQSIVWGDITGTLGNQTDLATALNAKLELTGGVLTVNSTIDASTATTSSTFAGDAFGVQLSANPSENSSLQYGGLQVQNAVGTMSVTPAGLTFPNASSQTVAYPGTAGFLLKADNLSGLADTAVSRTNLGLGTMATATAADYSTTTVANGLYYPLSGNPSGFITSSALTGYATETFVTSQGYITSSALTPYAPLAGSTFTGKVNTVASAAGGAGLNLPHGAAPTTPVNGDIWTTTSGLFARINAGTQQYMSLGNTQTVSGSITFSNANQTLGNSTAAGTINVGTGATISGSTKAVNIGTGGVAGSTTNIAIGSTTGTSTTTLQGITNGVTAAADTNSVALATTAYVVGQASAVAPSNDAATAAVGTSLRYARADHVHLNPLPAGGSANQVLAKVDATSYNTQWVTPSGGGSATDYQEFTTPGTFTWTKPAGAKWVDVVMFGGGGGGGAGGRYATSSARSGGAGGSGGTVLAARISASALGATQSIVVGAAGTSGAFASTDTTAGGTGGSGGNSTFYIFQAVGGSAGQGGSTTAPSATTGRVAWIYGTSPTAIASGTSGAGAIGAGAVGGTVTASNSYMPSGGAGGAGQAATVTTATAGAAGGSKTAGGSQSGYISAIAGGAAGTTGGTAPTAGVAGGSQTGGTGGGSGAYRTAVAGMAGAVGGFPGGGGGGGSASDNGFASGAGGAGGAGAVYIITYC